MTTYIVYANIDQPETKVSTHRTLAAAGRAYQAAHTGNMRRVVDQDGNDVTAEAAQEASFALLARPQRRKKRGLR